MPLPQVLLCAMYFQRQCPGPPIRQAARDTTSIFTILQVRLSSLINLITSSTRSLIILPQRRQQLPELSLLRPTRTTLRTLPTQIHQLRNPFPACPTSRRILSLLQKLLRLTTRLRNRLLLLGIVVLVEIINVLPRSLDRLSLPLGRFLFAFLEAEISALAPLLDDFGLLFVFGAGMVAGLKGGGSACDGAAWCDALSCWLVDIVM